MIVMLVKFGDVSSLCSHYPKLWININHEESTLSLRIYEKEIEWQKIELMLHRLEGGFNGEDVNVRIDKITNHEDCMEIAAHFESSGYKIEFA